MNIQTNAMGPERLILESEPLSIRRLLRAYMTETKFETLAGLRNPAFALPFLVIPVAIYLLFGVLFAGETAPAEDLGPDLPNFLFTGFCVVAVIMPGIFGGISLAIERDGHLVELRRALPMPPGATVVAKVLTAMAVSTLALILIIVAALFAGTITLALPQIAVIAATLIVGTIPFCAIGLFIGSIASATAAPAFGNLVFLPMMWLSGLFIPLPGVLERWVVIWPAFHLDQLALNLAGIESFSFMPPEMATAALAGFTVLFGGLAIRRLARIG